MENSDRESLAVYSLDLDDRYQVKALHLALMESKFNPEPRNMLVQSSPMVADIMNDVMDLMESINWATKAEQRFRGIEWRNDVAEWRKNPPEGLLVDHFRRHLKDNEYYSATTRDKRLEYLKILAAPYKPEEEILWRASEAALKGVNASGSSYELVFPNKEKQAGTP